MGHQYLSYDHGKTYYDKTLFVSTNGFSAGQLGRIDVPWSKVEDAIKYLRDNSLTGHSIIVFPGEYNLEDKWQFSISNTDTFIKFIGTVHISQSVSNMPLIYIDKSRLTLEGDISSSNGILGPGLAIKTNNSNPLFLNEAIHLTSSSTLIIKNAIVDSKTGVAFYLDGEINGSAIILDNTSVYSNTYNFFCPSRILGCKFEILNSFLYSKIPNNFYIANGGGDFYIKNSQLSLGAGSSSHIESNSSTGMIRTMDLSDVIFYSLDANVGIVKENGVIGLSTLKVMVTGDVICTYKDFIDTLGTSFSPVLINPSGVISNHCPNIQNPQNYRK